MLARGAMVQDLESLGDEAMDHGRAFGVNKVKGALFTQTPSFVGGLPRQAFAAVASVSARGKCVLCKSSRYMHSFPDSFLLCCGQRVCRDCLISLQRECTMISNLSSGENGRDHDVVKQCVAHISKIKLCKACGKSRPLSNREAFVLLQQHTSNSAPWAQFLMGKVYENGDLGCEKDVVKAISWYRAAASNGMSLASARMGELYLGNSHAIPLNYALARSYLLAAAEEGDARAHYNLGRMYQKGFGTRVDLSLAFQYFQTGSKAELPEAMNALGWCLEHGLGCSPALRPALRHYSRAGLLQHGEACLNTSRLILHIYGARHIHLALTWCKRAAYLGVTDAKSTSVELEKRARQRCVCCSKKINQSQGPCEGTEHVGESGNVANDSQITCLRCRTTYYCTHSCKNKHWINSHSALCGGLSLPNDKKKERPRASQSSGCISPCAPSLVWSHRSTRSTGSVSPVEAMRVSSWGRSKPPLPQTAQSPRTFHIL